MWIPQSLLTLFDISRETVESLRLEVGALRAENDILQRELASNKIMNDWLRLRHNQLEIERTTLLAKAYPGLTVPSTEIKRKAEPEFDIRAIFEDQSEPPLVTN